MITVLIFEFKKYKITQSLSTYNLLYIVFAFIYNEFLLFPKLFSLKKIDSDLKIPYINQHFLYFERKYSFLQQGSNHTTFFNFLFFYL